jgi:hypothetical protein
MAEAQGPLVLELATLSREQVGPFLLLGVSKEATREEVEAHWAQRLIAARKGGLSVPLEDINWSRETINDPERRSQALTSTLNADTDNGILRELAERYHVGKPSWPVVDAEKSFADYSPPLEMPDPAEVRSAITLPDLPPDLPAVAWLLDQFIPESLDPWAVPLTPDPSEGLDT